VSVRILLGIITLAALSGEAPASSLVFPGAPATTPSVLTLKADDTKASDVMSVVALGEPDVTYEKVAAIPNAPEARHGFMPGPMIIRGGVVGGRLGRSGIEHAEETGRIDHARFRRRQGQVAAGKRPDWPDR